MYVKYTSTWKWSDTQVDPIFVICPTSIWVWHKAVLRWVQSQGCSPDTSGSPKNALGPISIPLFGAPQMPGDKPNLSEEG